MGKSWWRTENTVKRHKISKNKLKNVHLKGKPMFANICFKVEAKRIKLHKSDFGQGVYGWQSVQ